MNIGPYELPNNVFVAPMAGVTDRPYRRLCKSLGAGYAVSEMAASNPQLWASEKTSRRLNHHGENAPVAVQIAKQLIDAGGAAGATLEALAGALAATTADGREGVAAFRERRSPEFIGN